MARLKIKEIGRNWWNRSARRDVYVNGRHSGVMTSEELELEIQPGPCKVTVQNSFPTFRSTAYINIEGTAENHVDFKDTKWFLNFLMVIDIIVLFFRNLIHLPDPLRTIADCYAIWWVLNALFNKEGHYRIFAYSRVAMEEPEYS